MITLKPIVPFTGPYRRRINWPAVVISIAAHVAIGAVLAYAVIGMTGALDEKPLTMACINCAGGVGR